MHDEDMTASTSTCYTSMLWTWNTIDSCFLAESWHITNAGSFASSCIGVALLVFLLEGLYRGRREIDAWILRGFQSQASVMTPLPLETSPRRSSLERQAEHAGQKPEAGGLAAATLKVSLLPTASGDMLVFRASPLQQLARAVVHAVTLGLAYVVMLLAMSFNGYIIICMIVGGGLGKFCFDWLTWEAVVGGSNAGATSVGSAKGCQAEDRC